MRTIDNLIELKRSEVKQHILKEFGKTEEDMKQYVQILKDWVNSQPHLPECPSDGMLIQFLNLNKYSIEKAKQKIDMYYTVRTLMPDFYEGTNPNSPYMKRQNELSYFYPLPVLAPNCVRVEYFRINENCGPADTNGDLIVAQAYNILEVLMQEDFAMGIIFVIDLSFFKASHVQIFNLMTLKKNAFISEKVYSNRVYGVHFLFAQSFVDVLINMFKAVVPNKIANRVFVHKNTDTLFQVLPQQIFPSDIGGDEVSLKTLNELWQEKFESYKGRFSILENLKVNEQLRPETLINDDILGYYGSFKKLNVD